MDTVKVPLFPGERLYLRQSIDQKERNLWGNTVITLQDGNPLKKSQPTLRGMKGKNC